jgi:hypothetical protein
MPRRAAGITQADVARVIRAAKQAGAAEVEVRVGGNSIVVRTAAWSNALALATRRQRENVNISPLIFGCSVLRMREACPPQCGQVIGSM